VVWKVAALHYTLAAAAADDDDEIIDMVLQSGLYCYLYYRE